MQGEHMSARQVRYPARQERRAHPTIGFLTFGISDEFGNASWNGVADSAQDQGVNLLTFPGQSLNHPYGFEAQANVIYDLASAENVAGLVISSTLCDYFDPEQTLAFFRRFQSLPIVSVGLEVEGIPSVMVDNKSGMKDVMAHLIESHGYQRIAFIRGPEGSQDAAERYLAYADALAEHGLALNPDLVAPGDFRFASGVAAIDLLQDERLVQYEAVVASNDVMALGALEALQARGIRVPNDVAVVGFDDQEGSRICVPPLTTVRHPVYESGKQSVEMLVALLRGRDIPERVTLPTQSVVRQSCGCPSLAVINAGAEHAIPAGEVVKPDRVAQRDHILSEMVQALKSRAPTTARDGAQKLVRAG
jgi:DNA-binding LacI/PurR family transcriptional regulator